MRDTEETVIDPTVDPSSGEPASRKEPEKPQEKPVDPKEFRLLQKQLEDQNRRIQELTESERYWAERAKHGGSAESDDELEPEDDDDPEPVRDEKPEKLVDDLSNKGIDALVARGVLTRKEAKELIQKQVAREARKIAEEVVGRERTKITTDTEIMQKYPDLQNPKSALFAKTSEVFKEVVRRNPAKAKDPEALIDAAERARLTLEIESLKSGRGRSEDDGLEPGERERRERIRAQSSDRGRRSSELDEEDDNRLGDEAREVIRQMGLTEDEFTDSRKRLGVVSRGRR